MIVMAGPVYQLSVKLTSWPNYQWWHKIKKKEKRKVNKKIRKEKKFTNWIHTKQTDPSEDQTKARRRRFVMTLLHLIYPPEPTKSRRPISIPKRELLLYRTVLTSPVIDLRRLATPSISLSILHLIHPSINQSIIH